MRKMISVVQCVSIVGFCRTGDFNRRDTYSVVHADSENKLLGMRGTLMHMRGFCAKHGVAHTCCSSQCVSSRSSSC